MNIHDLVLRSRFQRTLNRTCVQCIENAHETRIRSTNARASVYVNIADYCISECPCVHLERVSLWHKIFSSTQTYIFC